jgi:hypothetical protein
MEAASHNCGVPNKWPSYDADGLKDGEIKFTQSKDKRYTFEIAVPRHVGNADPLFD